MNESHRLRHGPYLAPPYRRGDRVTCLARDAEVVVTSWTGARISWPRCRVIGHRGGSGILVDDELARAVRNESAEAVRYWWGATGKTVAWWRKRLGVTVTSNPTTHELIRCAAEVGGEAFRQRGVTAEGRERRRENERRHNLRRNLTGRPDKWTAAQVALLGKKPDEDVARATGRTAEAVRLKRTRAGIPTAKDRRSTHC